MADYGGSFVVFEGLNGSGKSSAISMLKDIYPDFEYTREPTDNNLGEIAQRKIVEEVEDPITVSMLFAADRRRHSIDWIMPRLQSGDVVICDRYMDSTYAFQMPQLEDYVDDPKSFLDRLHGDGYIKPDLTIYMDCPPKICKSRVSGLESYEEISFQQDAYHIYNERIQQRANTRIVDASQKKSVVMGEVKDIFEEEFN